MCALLSRMVIVEQADYPSFRWGHDLTVRVDGECLLVSGRSVLGENAKSRSLASDLMHQYAKAPKNWSNKRSGKNAPHIRFANADTDRKLISFVKEFGPVVVCALTEHRKRSTFDVCTTLEGSQDLVELRRERAIYKSALQLIAFLSSERDPEDKIPLGHVSTIVENAGIWPDQWTRERKLGATPLWRFTKRNLETLEWAADGAFHPPRADNSYAATSCDRVICELINTFPIRVYRWGRTAIEGPFPDLRYGVRPLLYYFLRKAYLGRNSVSVCANERCRQIFETERAGQRFCSADCSRQQRQREYWADRGKKQRQDRKERERALGKNLG